MFRDLTLAIRGLIRQRAFTLAAAGTLALAIGASTAVFSTVNAALVRPLPYPRADDIYSLRTYFTDGRYTSGLVGPAELLGLAAASDDVVAAATGLRQEVTLQTDAGAFQIRAYGVSHGFFDVFGLPPAHGAGFTPDDHARGPLRAVVLSHRAWRTYFGGDPAIVGKPARIAGQSLIVKGIAAPEFDMPAGVDAWVAFYINPADVSHLFDAYVRVRPGTSIDALAAPMARVMEDLAIKYPDQNRSRAFAATPLLTSIVGDLGPVLLIVFAATGLLLVVAAVNVSNLMLARAVMQTREMAVKTALGATRWRLIRHGLAEASVLAALAGLAGAGLAWAGVRLLSAAGASELPRLADVTFDGRVVLFAAAVTTTAALVVGFVPVLAGSRRSVASAINEGGRANMISRRNTRVLAGLVAAEVAVAVALVAGAGRLVRSYENLLHEDTGFTRDARLVVDVSLPFDRYGDPARFDAWLGEAASRLRAIGIDRVAAATSLPLRTEADRTTFVDLVKDPTTDPHARPNARMRRVSAGFVGVMGMELVAGRDFSEGDRRGAAPVVIVSQRFADRFLAGRDPLQERVTIPGVASRMADGRLHHDPVQIVGVVADARYAGLGAEPEQSIYLPLAQVPGWRFSLIAASSHRDVETMGTDVRRALVSLDAGVPIDVTTLGDVVRRSVTRQRLGMALMVTFGLAALLLMGVGVFGVIAFVVSQRSGEMAVRLALGATGRQLYWMVMQQSGLLVAGGALGGAMLAWWTGALMAGYVYEVERGDPIILAGSVGLVSAAALLATQVLARRAAAVSPSHALRG